jgi:hypothetical protein
MRLGSDVIAGGRKGVLVKTVSHSRNCPPVAIGVVFLKNFEDWTGLQRITMFAPHEVITQDSAQPPAQQ